MSFQKNLAFKIGAKWNIKPVIACGIPQLRRFDHYPNAKFVFTVTAKPSDEEHDQTKSKVGCIDVFDENGTLLETVVDRRYTHSFLKKNAEYQGALT